MDLTPIRVSGKNRRDNSKKAISKRKALRRTPGRPLKEPTSNAASQSSASSTPSTKKFKRRTLENIKAKRKMSLLERLPTEILETVFLYCLNLELPRASPVIAGKLSSEIIYLHAILSAFDPTWGKWHGREKILKTKRYNEEDSVDIAFEGDPKFQSSILRCRFVTVSRLLAAKDTWIQKNGQDRAFKPEYFSKPQQEDETLSKLTATEYFDNDFTSFSEFTQERDRFSIRRHYNWDVNRDLAAGVEIPSSLLLGPWTEDSIKLLFWLIKAGARIDWVGSTSGEVAREGLQRAIITGNTTAIHLLEWAGLIEELDFQTLIWSFRNAGGDKNATVNHILRIGLSQLPTRDIEKIGRGLADMQNEAEHEGDQAKLRFVKGIKEYSPLF
ncbi:hypothetical protein NA56DRAFT_640553 [Hyaloscypha hepaticicola]|uniref:Uncharacterized protein n=1 Tax=Hyaloscypha hepaticicola TaxID=2082293 RepID=A0A2J6QNE9_9HELO|nr:hypothetical protein NA56DRAFT_640553 [Hyaloscypha hepaticicola]